MDYTGWIDERGYREEDEEWLTPTSGIYIPNDSLQKHTALYREFIHAEQPLDFTNAFGLLGLDGEPVPAPEKITDWKLAQRKLASVVKLWDAIQSNDRKYLRKVIKWKKERSVMYDEGKDFWLLLEGVRPDGSRVKRGELIWPAYQYIEMRINHALDKYAAPRMVFTDDNELKLRIRAKTLLGHMWLQVADVVTYDMKERTCGWCGMPFQLDRNTRADRKWCSDSCRVSASRQRRRTSK